MCGCGCICLWKCEVITSWTAWPNTCWLYHGNYHYWTVLKQHQVCCCVLLFCFGGEGGCPVMRCLYSAVNHVRKWCFVRMIYYCCCCFFSLWGSSPTAVKDTLFLVFIHLWVSLDVVSTVLITDGKLWLSLLVLLTDVTACLTHRCHCLS